MAQVCKTTLKKLRQEDSEFKANLAYAARPGLARSMQWICHPFCTPLLSIFNFI